MKTQSQKAADLILASQANRQDLNYLEHADPTYLNRMGNDANNFSLEHLAAVNPQLATAVAATMASAGNKGKTFGHPISSFRAPVAAATITINATRKILTSAGGGGSLVDSNGNFVDLPSPIFGVGEFQSLWYRVINRYLPQDGSVNIVSVVQSADQQSIIITYSGKNSLGEAATESITITMIGAPYTNLVRFIQGMAFTVSQPKVRISDATRTDQFEVQFKMFYGSAWGKTSDDYLVANDYETDLQLKDNIRVLATTLKFDPEHTFVPLVVQPTTQAVGNTFTLGFTMYIQNFDKFNEFGSLAHPHK